MRTNIGAKIKYFRKELGLSQEALALEADISPAHLGRIERNEKNPTIETLDKIISAIGISYDEFFSGISGTDVNEERKFFIDRAISSLNSLPDEKLKDVAEAIVKIVNAVK